MSQYFVVVKNEFGDEIGEFEMDSDFFELDEVGNSVQEIIYNYETPTPQTGAASAIFF